MQTEAVEPALVKREEVCRQVSGSGRGIGPLTWPSADSDSGVLELSLEAEREYVERELHAQIEAGQERTRQTRVKERWRLADEAGRLLAEERDAGWRVALCHKCKIPTPTNQPVGVYRSRDGNGHAFLRGLQRCGLLWVCAVCAAKITELRRKELSEAVEDWTANGGTVALLTLTAPHHPGTKTRQMCDRFIGRRGAFKLMQNRTFWRTWTKTVGLKGTVRSLEVTYTLNGPHVHLHVLLFCAVGAATPSAADLLPAWKKACLDAGLDEPNEHGVDVKAGNTAVADYVGKWGMDYELTKSHVKHGRGIESRTPFDLLRASAAGDEAAGQLFIEYANAFKGRRQLVWSKGLRKLLQLGREETDGELAEKPDEDAEYIGTISGDEHSGDLGRVIRWRAHGALLVAVERDGQLGLSRFLRGLETLDVKRSQRRHVWRN